MRLQVLPFFLIDFFSEGQIKTGIRRNARASRKKVFTFCNRWLGSAVQRPKMFDDHHIITRIKAGDQQAFGMLIARYQRMVGAMVFRMVRDPLDREEISQDVFIRAYRSLNHFRGDAKFSTWLGRIAYNQCITYLKRKRLPLYEDLLAGGSDEEGVEADRWGKLGTADDHPGRLLEEGQASSLLKKAVDELPGQYGVVLAMFHLEELSVKEIGEMMEMPEGTVKNYLYRARKMLKDKLENSIWREA